VHSYLPYLQDIHILQEPGTNTGTEETPPRPAPPYTDIESMNPTCATVEHPPPRPSPPTAPPLPQRSNSLGRLQSVGPSPQNTPKHDQKIRRRPLQTQSQSQGQEKIEVRKFA
jgi:hypothetical protein